MPPGQLVFCYPVPSQQAVCAVGFPDWRRLHYSASLHALLLTHPNMPAIVLALRPAGRWQVLLGSVEDTADWIPYRRRAGIPVPGEYHQLLTRVGLP